MILSKEAQQKMIELGECQEAIDKLNEQIIISKQTLHDDLKEIEDIMNAAYNKIMERTQQYED